jgi:hypothetical protein
VCAKVKSQLHFIGALPAPLLLAGDAVIVAIHLDAWAILQEVGGFLAGGHLRAVLSTVAREVCCRSLRVRGPGEWRGGLGGVCRELLGLVGLVPLPGSECQECYQQQSKHFLDLLALQRLFTLAYSDFQGRFAS